MTLEWLQHRLRVETSGDDAGWRWNPDRSNACHVGVQDLPNIRMGLLSENLCVQEVGISISDV